LLSAELPAEATKRISLALALAIACSKGVERAPEDQLAFSTRTLKPWAFNCTAASMPFAASAIEAVP